MKSRVYLMSLAMLMGLSGKIFAAANGSPAAERPLISERTWASETDRSNLDNQTYYDGTYIPGLSYDNLVLEQEVVNLELSAAQSNYDKEKEERQKLGPQQPPSAAYRAAALKFLQARNRNAAVDFELSDKLMHYTSGQFIKGD